MSKDFSNINTVVVHNGLFHADDTLTIAMLRTINPEIKVIRTRDPEIIAAHQNKSTSIVADVGLGEYDHHQKDAKVREDGHKYAAAGLVYNDIKEKLFPDNPELQKQFEDIVIKPVEHADNGELDLEEDRNPITRYVKSCIPAWNSTGSLEDGLIKALSELTPMIEDIMGNKEILPALTYIEELTDKQEKENERAYDEGIETMEKVYAEVENKQVIELPHPGIPRSNLCEKDTIFTIYKTLSNQVNIQAVPPEAGSFDQKISIYKDAFDDFKDKMGADANIFVHPAGFLASITLSDTVSEQDAKDYLFEKADELIQEHEQEIEEQEMDEQDTEDTLEDL